MRDRTIRSATSRTPDGSLLTELVKDWAMGYYKRVPPLEAGSTAMASSGGTRL
jgi:hypothetical protein